ncbi:DUF5134 domain-containing protein [Frankia sp. AiPs1]|uniref:DUF5134 domain-containing protein n=1 Tax=Frankia sp. AiPa1 TaxID=573492 RepID=UPI00202B8952|nr:DUF5134 domain-containing protein [Frankia sp. AiPa1]MCL9761448.1 DUF5134 domain-containing protein [Frankia sp. AiPa1]
MNHDHLARSTAQLPVAVTVVAAALAAVVGLFHAVRVLGVDRGWSRWSRLPEPVRRVVGDQTGLDPSARFVPAEIGHTVVAAGMVVMFVGPASWSASLAFTLGCVALALAFLVLVLTGPACCEPARWSCCSMLVVEFLAMACMARAGRWPMADFGAPGDLSGWLIVVFAVSAASALVGSAARRAWAAHPVRTAPITPAASRLVMASAMLIMLV